MIITHSTLKDIYFAYKNSDDDYSIDEEKKDAIREYLDRIDEFEHKRNWSGAERMDDHAEMFARRLLD